jgi:uncharacterized protein
MLSSRLTSHRCTASILRRFHRANLPQARSNSDLAPSPRPADLLARLPKDVHAALRARDKTRLSTLRSLLSDVTNSSKTQHPIADDLALLSAINQRIASTKQSVEEFGRVGRADLVESEEASLRVLEEYAGSVETMSDEEIRDVVLQAMAGLQEKGEVVNTGSVMKACLKRGGPFEGRMVTKGSVAKLVDKIVKADHNKNLHSGTS